MGICTVIISQVARNGNTHVYTNGGGVEILANGLPNELSK